MVKNKKNKTFLLWGVGIVLMALYTYLTVEMVTSGAILAKLEKDESALLQQNKEMQESIVRESSLNGFEKRSQELGFVKPAKILYINSQEEVAKLP